VNPFGPVERADGSAGFYSDGETVWRYDPADPVAPPDSLGPGAFPALSPDGMRLAAAVPLGLDSTSGQCQAALCPCRQETVTITTTGWEVRLYDLAGGSAVALGAGLEPAFDPLEARLVVRRTDGLYWVTLATGDATSIAGTAGGYAPAVSPDGTVLAFTADRFEGPDVFFVRIR
jgi:Tol biopolymer transport system component